MPQTRFEGKSIVHPEPGQTFRHVEQPAPHEFEGEIKVSRPVHYIECTCGYSGFAHLVDGKEICPSCENRKLQNQEQTQETLSAIVNKFTEADLDAMVNARVQAALERLKATEGSET